MFIMTGSRGGRGRGNSIAKRGALLKTTAVAGLLEYDGKVFYNTPQGTQRGIDPSMQFYRLNAALAGSNATGVQSLFGKGVTLASSTVYAYEIVFALTKTVGTTAHAISRVYGGTATLNNIFEQVLLTVTPNVSGTSAACNVVALSVATATAVTNSGTGADQRPTFRLTGTVSVNSGGTFIPQYSLSVAPGGAYSTDAGSYALFYPIGTSGADTNVGAWA